jgi:AraC-like DNA-binding protein
MLLNEIKPSAFLAEYVRLYRIVDFHFPAGVSLPFKMYPPRPEHCLQFYPRDTETVEYIDRKQVITGKRAVIIGQHTMVNRRHVGRDFFTLQVVFQPGALYRITGVPSGELTNIYTDAEHILGTVTRSINEQLFHAKSYEEMIQVVEIYLGKLVKKLKYNHHALDVIGKLMTEETDHYSLDGFIKQAFLCHRQFDRKFLERVGISPKQYLQVTRFDKAFRMKNRFPEKDWLTIALHCGYYDYQHLVKDYKLFTGHTPKQFLAMENNAPERSFGEKEI